MSSSTVHATQPLTADELANLWAHLHDRSALIEAGLLAACLGLAWLMVRLWRGKQSTPGSVWFGDHLIDGVLFPILALLLSLGLRRLLINEVPMAVFRVAIPVLLSLAIIRLTVKVLKAAFPASQALKVVERTVSWMAWLGTVLWITGALPL